MVTKKKMKVIKSEHTTCYTRCMAEWKCPFCDKVQTSEIPDDYPHAEEVKCIGCNREVLITEE